MTGSIIKPWLDHDSCRADPLLPHGGGVLAFPEAIPRVERLRHRDSRRCSRRRVQVSDPAENTPDR